MMRTENSFGSEELTPEGMLEMSLKRKSQRIRTENTFTIET
jgi:hypothetical protein